MQAASQARHSYATIAAPIPLVSWYQWEQQEMVIVESVDKRFGSPRGLQV